MAMIKSRTNPINIAPFVDVLLILFVILVVVARFDGISKAEEYIQVNKKLAQQIKQLKDKIVTSKKSFSEVINKNKALKKELEIKSIDLKSKKNLLKNEDTIKTLKDKNRELAQHIKKLKADLLISKESFTKITNKNKALQNKFKLNNATLSSVVILKQDNKKLKSSKRSLELSIKNLKADIENLKTALKQTQEDLISYKDNPKRKDDLHLSIDRAGKIWLINAITRKQLLEITFQNLEDILASLTFANIRYFFYEDSKKSLSTVKKIQAYKQIR